MTTTVVVGASRGIGLGLALGFAAQGEQVIATTRSPAPELDRPGITVRSLEVTEDASVEAFVAGLKGTGIDRLVLNAGVLGPRDQTGVESLDVWQQVLMTNTAAPLRLAALLLDRVAASVRRQIVFISSDNASLTLCEADKPIYRASKAGLNCGMRALSLMAGERGPTLFAVHPGWVKTDMGGPRASISVAESVTGMLALFDRDPAPESGSYWNWRGDPMPW